MLFSFIEDPNLEDTNLEDANLEGTNLEGTYLEDTNLEDGFAIEPQNQNVTNSENVNENESLHITELVVPVSLQSNESNNVEGIKTSLCYVLWLYF